jgi:hypothetical protein
MAGLGQPALPSRRLQLTRVTLTVDLKVDGYAVGLDGYAVGVEGRRPDAEGRDSSSRPVKC